MEIERKFLVDEDKLLSSVNLEKVDRVDILQGCYLTTESEEYRVRKVTKADAEKYYFTVKSKGDLVRQEVEVEISYSDYQKLIGGCMGGIIEKTRYLVPLSEKLIAEVDVYKNDLQGIRTVEVEFESRNQAETFKIPSWFGKEVTYDERYKSWSLACKGIPELTKEIKITILNVKS
jgi:CYTH domain-containing protein